MDSLVRVLHAVESARLSANDQYCLRMTLGLSLAQVETGQYVSERIAHASKTRNLEDVLLSLKDDLMALAEKINQVVQVPQDLEAAARERENNRCAITGQREDLRAIYIIPPSFLEDEDLRPEGKLRPLLESLISTALVEQLDVFLKAEYKSDQLRNIWLMSPSARHDFLHSHLCITRTPVRPPHDFHSEERDTGRVVWEIQKTTPVQTQLDTNYFSPTTPDPTHLPLPRKAAVYIHQKLSLPLHFKAIERQIQRGWPSTKQDGRTLGKIGTFLLRKFLRLIPIFMRLALYRHACRAGKIRRLPLGLFLKRVRGSTMHNEAHALVMVEKHTTVPAPKLIDFATQGETGFILMTRVPGQRLDEVLYRMTHEDRAELGKDIGRCIAQWRQIPNDNPRYEIANTLGGPIYDHRFEERQCGPYESNKDFADYLTEYLEDKRHEQPLSAMYEDKLKVYFTHSDLHRTNIFVQQGRLSGIVDWEHAGFKPEYWEYTKALWPYMAALPEQKGIFIDAFDENYAEQLEAEMYLWKEKPVY